MIYNSSNLLYIGLCIYDKNHSVTIVTVNKILKVNKAAIYKLLDKNKNQRGIENWNKMHIQDWSSFAIGLTQLKKQAKQVGRNHDLVKVLWKEPN